LYPSLTFSGDLDRSSVTEGTSLFQRVPHRVLHAADRLVAIQLHSPALRTPNAGGADHRRIGPSSRRSDLHILDGEFRLKPISKPRDAGRHHCFSALPCPHWNSRLISVIVSRYDGDGAAALCGIKKAGGITIAPAA
jgi:hypothetical protein